LSQRASLVAAGVAPNASPDRNPVTVTKGQSTKVRAQNRNVRGQELDPFFDSHEEEWFMPSALSFTPRLASLFNKPFRKWIRTSLVVPP